MKGNGSNSQPSRENIIETYITRLKENKENESRVKSGRNL